MSKYPGMQLEDFNYAMLRGIYAFHLVFFALAVFVLGILLIPLGYVAVLVTRGRLILREWRVKHKR